MKRILIIKPSSLGDVVHAFPAVHALLASNSEWTADWVIHPAFAELLDYLPGIRRKILFRRQELGHFRTFFPAARELLRELWRERYDAVIDLQGLFRSALVGLLARGGCLYGPADAREGLARIFYRRRLHCPDSYCHAIEKNCALIRDFSGLQTVSPEYRFPEVEKYSLSAENLFKDAGAEGKYTVAVAPGARWETKQWPPEFFAECVKQIAGREPDCCFVLLGSPTENELCRRTMENFPGVHWVNLCGRTSPGVLVEVIRRSDLLFCNDSGPMHLAAGVGTPAAALFGPTDPVLTGPYGRNCRVIRPELECVGCFHRFCRTEKCHKSVSPQLVAEQISELLKQGGGCR